MIDGFIILYNKAKVLIIHFSIEGYLCIRILMLLRHDTKGMNNVSGQEKTFSSNALCAEMLRGLSKTFSLQACPGL